MKLNALNLFIAAVYCTFFLIHSQGISFNCQRPNVECQGKNSTCPDDGSATCVCSDDAAGYDCGYNKTAVSSSCSLSCKNGATCWTNENGDEACYCNEQYYGKNCEKSRTSLKCTPDSMEMGITPHVGSKRFGGFVYIWGQDADDSCNFVASSEAGVTSLKKTVPYSDCGGAAESTNADGDTVRAFVVVVQYDADFQTEDDEEFHMKCAFKQSGSLISMTTALEHDNSNNTALGGGTVEAKLNPVQMDVLDADGNQITTPRKIGDVIQLRFSLAGGNVYTAFRVETVSAENGLSGQHAKSVDLVTSRCVPKKRKKIVVEFTEQGGSIITLKMKLFRLRSSNKLTFLSRVKICQDTTDCNATMCNDTQHLTGAKFGGGVGRGKRDVISSEDYTRYENLKASVTILEGPNAKVDNRDGETRNLLVTEECIRSPGILLIISVLATLLIITVASTIYFFARAIRVNNEKQLTVYDNPAMKH